VPRYTEMVASATLVGLNRSDLCRDNRSCSNISVPGSAVTKRASGVSSGIFVHQDRSQFSAICELAHVVRSTGSTSGPSSLRQELAVTAVLHHHHRYDNAVPYSTSEMCKCAARDEPRCTTAMKKHNHSSDDRLIQYRGKYSRHSRGQALTKFASDRHTGATCLKPSRRTIEALAPALSSLVCLSLN
jgi:hypothetical protein